MFIDTSYAVREILSEPTYFDLVVKTITLIGFLPGLFEESRVLRPRLEQNAYAALLELEHYGTPWTDEELFLGIQSRGQRSGGGFEARWDDREHWIQGPGWDTCYLVDNVNDFSSNSPLPAAQIFEMAAEFLFLDFQQNRFSAAKRSAGANMVQYLERYKETLVRGLTDVNDPSNPRRLSDVIYRTRNSCRFSSFGLAEVLFDIEGLYKAAGYRLASHLVRQRWIGQADVFPEERYGVLAQDHLLDPKSENGGGARGPSFRPEALTRLLLQRTDDNWLDVLAREVDELSDVEPAQGLEILQRLLNEHHMTLRSGGEAQETVIENRRRLEGDTKRPGILRARLDELASKHCSRFGADPTLSLLGEYRNVLGSIRENVRSQAKQEPDSDLELLGRLREAGLSRWPLRTRRVAREYERACRDVATALDRDYREAARAAIEPLLTAMVRYIGDANLPVDSQQPARYAVCAVRRAAPITDPNGRAPREKV